MKASESRKTDRIIVIVSALLGLGLTAFAIVKANGFNQQFPQVAKGNPSKGKDLLEKAAAQIEETRLAATAIANPNPVQWSRANAAGKERGFLASTGLVFRKGADESSDSVVDLDKAEPRLREPFSNEYWLKFPGLSLEYANVGELDTDEDYFTNLQEWEYSQQLGQEFSPIDPKSHPSLHFLLRFVQFEQTDYELKFTTASPPDFGLRHENNNREKKWSDTASLNEDANANNLLDEGEDKNFNQTLDAAKPAGKKQDEGRFIVLDYKQVEVKDGDFVEKKYQITVQDTTRPPGHPDERFQILEGETKKLATRIATFDFLPRPGAPIIKREFEKFTLPDTLVPSYLLKSVDADMAILEIEEGGAKKAIQFPRGQSPTP